MSNIAEYKDIMAFHPGYYVADIIEDMGISQSEFAARVGTTAKTLSQLINGQAKISNDLAKKLSVMTGTGVDVWQNLQNTYDRKLIEMQKAEEFDEQKNIAAQIDYSYFVNVAGLPYTKNAREKVANLCKFFKVSDLRIMRQPDFLVNFRSGTSDNSEKKVINSRAWIQTALNIAQNIKTEPYDAKKLKGYLPELRSMTLQSPEVFLARMQRIFAECGVAFVLLPHLRNSGVNGAVKWINSDRVVLAMNNRGLDADKFWFSLFHEVEHVFQQKTKTVFISSTAEKMTDINIQLENDADKFAADFLIPPDDYKNFAPTKYTSDDEIIDFARTVGIHPGIVAGRLQHEKIIPQNRCSGLKEKYIIEIKRQV
ncbi:HigA family addiction module antitoxin [Hornefia butyriciproducens]|uniref:HigA family addiction module antitoxin n=1 Tax=Hornefia butyriciproducens TaxID=2652293 RepID=UPI0023F367B5|nr:HigA family addiction module antitoxin [Hornefia butyriciproducens]MCI7327511.1 HigA family addiction module antitoxin [Clostridiales bacterium]MDD6299463.1 HigA family addiction module antitoxin [Hornefia butyriciproducens]MDY2990758.1 HigA family addiction module antitoxin [Hornefia butyriciproducens]